MDEDVQLTRASLVLIDLSMKAEHAREQSMFWKSVWVSMLGFPLVFCVFGTFVLAHRRHVRINAEAGLRKEIEDNLAGVRDLRQALNGESRDVMNVAEVLQAKANGRAGPALSLHLGLAVMSFTDANWRAATATGAVDTLEYRSVARYAGAYFEQARLAQMQSSTLESMMMLQSYVGRGDDLSSLTPDQAGKGADAARLLFAHLRTMLRMTDGVQDAYITALGK